MTSSFFDSGFGVDTGGSFSFSPESPINNFNYNLDTSNAFNNISYSQGVLTDIFNNVPEVSLTNTGYDWGSFWNFGETPQFGIDTANAFDLPSLQGPGLLAGNATNIFGKNNIASAPLPSTTVKGFADVFKGIFELPSIISLGKGILQGATAVAAYQNRATEAQMATAAANQEYWARYADTVAQNYRQYQVQLETYYRDLDYAQRRRDYEDQLAKQQAEYKGAVASQAFKNFEKQIADLEGRFYEEEAKETIEMENIRIQSIAAASKTKAKGQAGRSIESLNNQYHQQYLANLSNREITRNYRIADKVRQAEALDVARQNTSNQIQFYTPQPIPDPVKPLAPLPITAVPPTPESRPSGTALTIDLTNIATEALNNYQSMQPPAPKPVNQ